MAPNRHAGNDRVLSVRAVLRRPALKDLDRKARQAKAKTAEQECVFRNPIYAVVFRPSCLAHSQPFSVIAAVKGFLSLTKGVQSSAMIPQDLLDILVCPVCKQPLVLKDEGQSLKCGECRRVYPIRDDIPILLVDEAVTEPS